MVSTRESLSSPQASHLDSSLLKIVSALARRKKKLKHQHARKQLPRLHSYCLIVCMIFPWSTCHCPCCFFSFFLLHWAFQNDLWLLVMSTTLMTSGPAPFGSLLGLESSVWHFCDCIFSIVTYRHLQGLSRLQVLGMLIVVLFDVLSTLPCLTSH